MKSIILILVLLISINCKDKGKMRSLTTMEICKEMGIGINLGNTFDAFGDWIKGKTPKDYYTAWGAPEVTKEMIQGIYNEGFRVLRLPVHWFNLMDEDYNINEDYAEIVNKVVDWALDAKLYVILNIHHDDRELFSGFPKNKEKNMEKYLYIWKQIAERYQDYGDYLIFENMNEEGCWDSVYNPWGDGSGKEEAFGLLNEINQNFVDFIRSTGGNNPERHLLIAGYCTGLDTTCDPLYKPPSDPANRFALSVHYYSPSTFTILTEDADWGKAQSTWGTKDDLNEMNKNLDLVKNKLVDKGIPVIVGEYGCPTKNKEIESVHKFLYSVCKGIYDRDMVPILWDGPGGYYNRTEGIIGDSELKELLMSVPN